MMAVAKLAVLAVTAAAFAFAGPAFADPTVSGPIPVRAVPGSPDHDYPFFAANQPLATRGYVEEEYVLEGRARPHTSGYGARTFEDGRFLSETSAFKTRLVVRRPSDPRRFNGVVVVEWNNVSNGFDADNVWLSSWEHLTRSGYAWIGLTAQGYGGTDALAAWSPKRYGRLGIPSEGRMTAEPYALDVFDQLGRALRSLEGPRLLGGKTPRTLIAAGQSQSAIWLATYINGGLGRQGPYDGYLLLSAMGAPVRPDPPVPVLKIVPEGDLRGREIALIAPDTERFRQWEIAGASHVDRYLRSNREPTELRDRGTSVQATIAPKCAVPSIGTTTPAHLVLAAGLDHLVRQAQGGAAPPVAPRMTREQTAEGVALQRDPTGFASGGIRLPNIVAPAALEVGANSGAPGCEVQGYSLPFAPDVLKARYRSAQDRRRLLVKSAKALARAGFIPSYAVDNIAAAADRDRW